jgi:hypothetical protein
MPVTIVCSVKFCCAPAPTEIVSKGATAAAAESIFAWDARRWDDCALSTSEPVEIVTPSQPLAAAENPPNSIDPDTPPVEGSATVWADVLGVTHSVFVAVGSDVRDGAIGAVGAEPLPEHAVATPSDRAAHIVRDRREGTKEKRFVNVTEAAPFTIGAVPGGRAPGLEPTVPGATHREYGGTPYLRAPKSAVSAQTGAAMTQAHVV